MEYVNSSTEAGPYTLVVAQNAKEGQEDDGSVSTEWGHNFFETSLKRAVVYSCRKVKQILQNRKDWNLCEVEVARAVLKFKGMDDRDITQDVKQGIV